MSSPSRKRATFADLEALPEGVVGELLDGELVVSPRPALAHARAATELVGELLGPFGRGRGGPGGWVLLIEPELHLGADVLVPDLAGWRRERMPEVPETAASELAPDWICEVLSPSTEALDRARKLTVYAREQVPHVWLLNPGAKTLEVLRRVEITWQLVQVHHGDAPVRAEPFDAVEIALGALWSR